MKGLRVNLKRVALSSELPDDQRGTEISASTQRLSPIQEKAALCAWKKNNLYLTGDVT